MTSIILFPWLAPALRDMKSGGAAVRPWTMGTAALRLVSEVAGTAIPLLFVGRSIESWGGFGLKRLRPAFDLGVGMVTCILMLGSWKLMLLMGIPGAKHDWHSWQRTEPGLARLLGIAAIVASAFLQELVFRAWLLTRLTLLTGRTFLALAISTVLFASYHLYQSPLGLRSVLVHGLMLGTLYLASRRLWPCVVAHAAYNLFLFFTG